MYSTILENFNSSVNVSIPGIRDRGYLVIDKVQANILELFEKKNFNFTEFKEIIRNCR